MHIEFLIHARDEKIKKAKKDEAFAKKNKKKSTAVWPKDPHISSVEVYD